MTASSRTNARSRMTARPTRARSVARAIAAFFALLLLAFTGSMLAPPQPAFARDPSASATPAFTLRVDNVTPTTPVLSYHPNAVVVTLTLHNYTGRTVHNVSIVGFRGDPIGNQQALTHAIRHPNYDPASRQTFPSRTSDALAGQDMDIAFKITTDIPQDADLCLCHNAIYPLSFIAVHVGSNGVSTDLAMTQTYLPSFTKAPAQLQVAWIWPLLDRPHRAGPVAGSTANTDNVFLNDNLTREVSPGGRLDTELQVVEDASPTVPMTLLIDPDLIDELAVMATGKYVVRPAGSNTTVPGTGGAAAAAWLTRLRAVLPSVQLEFTPFADPDIESVVSHHLSWSDTQAIDPAAAKRIAAVLGGVTPSEDLAWPAGGTLSGRALAALVRHGRTTVVLGERSFTAGREDSRTAALDALAPISTRAGEATALVTSRPIERWVRRVVSPFRGLPTIEEERGATPPATGMAAIPELVSEVAVRAVEDPSHPTFVVLTPPRSLAGVNARVVAAAMVATTQTYWAQPVLVRDALAAVTPVSHGAVVETAPTAVLPGQPLQILRRVESAAALVAPLFEAPGSVDAQSSPSEQQLASVVVGAQRCESSGLLGHPDYVLRCARRLRRYVNGIRHGVHLVRPATRNYTLASRTSSLPVTVRNDLNVSVYIDINVATKNGVPGLTADPVEKELDARSTQQFRVPTTVDRTGRIPVVVRVTTRTDLTLGHPIVLNIDSTALGTVGVVITVVAGVVLVLALIVRVTVRLYRRSHDDAPAKVSA